MSNIASSLTTIEKAIAVLAAAGLAFTTFKANTIANQVAIQKDAIEGISRRQDLELSARQDARAEVKEMSELTHKIFDEFVEALKDKKNDPEIFIDRMSGVLVLTDAIPNPEQRLRMSQAVQQAIGRVAPQNAASAIQLEELKFDAEEVSIRAEAQQKATEIALDNAGTPVAHAATTPADVGKWGNYDLDIFWCEGQSDSGANQAIATRIAGFRSTDSKASGRWRLRPLPVAVNQRSGYRVSGIQVRVSSEDERPIAQQLIKLMDTQLGIRQATIKPTIQKTPWYLSVFVCGAGAG
jgi:hypothetical protein